MEFKLALLAVKSVAVSKQFYAEVFEQEVVLDLGRNVTFSGGFAIQEDFDWLTGVPAESIVKKSHNMELYFEVEDFDAFLDHLAKFKTIEYVHPPKKHEWQQRVVRIYDPDQHIIEIGESMGVIVRRYLEAGLSPEETAVKIHSPLDFVLQHQS